MANRNFYCRQKQVKHENERNYCRCMVTVFQVIVFYQNVSCIAAQGYTQSSISADGIIHGTNVFSTHEGNVEPNTGTAYLDPKQVVSSQADVIRFEPPFLDFDTQPIGIPNMRIVRIYNPSKTKSLMLNAISARTSHFHSSFFDEKVVAPNSNTSFEVVFLARVVGNVENTLFIGTAVGTFSYQVFGVGTPNPYRLRSYLGAKVSVNSTFSPLISMHNPTGMPLQVTEVYTSSGYLHLQLPTGVNEASKLVWEIPPYETKSLVQASFLGQVADNHTAFIRIKTNHTDITQYLILPVEVEVSSTPGIYSSLEMLDFGTLRTQDKPKVLNLFLLNSGSKEVQIMSVTTQHENLALKIDFKPIRLKPSEAVFTRVANISFNVKSANRVDQQSGTIIVRTKEKSYAKLYIPYQTNILNGTLGYDEPATFFHIPQKGTSKMVKQNISLTNTFDFPIILHKLELPGDVNSFYKIANFTSPCLIPTEATVTCFTVQCMPHAFLSLRGNLIDVVDTTHHLVLHTNASTFSLPLHTFTGLLTYKIQHGHLTELDFGIMGTLDKRQLLLAIYNHNPLQVPVLDCNSTLKGVEVTAISLTKNNEEVQPIVKSQFQNIILPADSCIVFEVILSAPKTESDLKGSFNIFTTYETLEIPLKARVAIGSLSVKPPTFKFRPSFPGMTVHLPVSISSSFAQTASMETISCSDKKFFYSSLKQDETSIHRKLKNVGIQLEPGKELKVGKVYFDARQDCKPDRCYVGLPTSTTVGHHWLTTLNLGKEAPDVDVKLYKTLTERWRSIQQNNITKISTKFEISTNLVQNLFIETTAKLYWPSLLEESEFEFSLTHVGKATTSQFILHNPSDVPVILQIMPISIYPQPNTILNALNMSHLLEVDNFITNDTTVFNISLPPNSSMQDSSSQMMWLEYTLNGKTNRSCLNVFLNPGQKQEIDVKFSPVKDVMASTLILLRNNLTVLDTVLVSGRGVREELKLGGKLSNIPTESLRFKLSEPLLQDCSSEVHKEFPNFTVRKSFTAKNPGLMPLQILYFMIDNYPCEGYGFRILDCEAFYLQPNATRDIIIAFTPDFTRSLVLHTLRIFTSQGTVLSYKLNVTLPYHLLPACQAAMPRPEWEPLLYYGITIAMMIMFVVVLLYAYLEAMDAWESFLKENNKFNDPLLSRAAGKVFSLPDIVRNFDSNNTLKKPGGFLHSLKARSFHLLSFDLLHLFRGKRKVESLSEEDPESVFNSEKQTPVSNITPVPPATRDAPVSSRTRQRHSARRSKSNNSWNTNREHREVQTNTNNVERIMELIRDGPPDWTPPVSNPVPDEKTDSNESNTRKESSGSSIESSRSRGNSISSGISEPDKGKQAQNKAEVSKRRRRNKPCRQPSFIRDIDDSSSTTTEKSSEDFDEKPISIEDSRKQGKRRHAAESNKARKPTDFGKRSANFEQGIELPYTTTQEQNLRRRYNRQTSPRKTTTDYDNSFAHKPNKSFDSKTSTPLTSRTPYDTSSTDEPNWDLPKTISKQDPDEMRDLAEKTKKIDRKMRLQLSLRNKENNEKNSSYSSVLSSSNEATNKATTVTKAKTTSKKRNLLKATSMPDSFPVIQQVAPTSLAESRRKSEVESNSGFSMFAATVSGPNETNPTLLAPNPSTTLPPWNNFGQNSFNITEATGLRPAYATTAQYTEPRSPSLSSPQCVSYSPPILSIPPSVSTPDWGNHRQLDLTTQPPLHGSPTTPKLLPMQSEIWNNSPSPRSTHEIWSVINAVTMDENRNTAENDPLGRLKSIWSSDTIQTGGGRNDLL
ncbi:transmembrane protein 131-like isoform X1 [Clavelina lepadiformis]|uniref:transmembrane protein 131-like isoform X1 n=1 Tax=Clavelina lepadiformis TaxID=159417 RepID=UPI004041BEDF